MNKDFLFSVVKAFSLSFLVGVMVWTMILRPVRYEERGKSKIGLVFLSEVKKGDEVVFKYPKISSPYTKSIVLDKNGRKIKVRVSNDEVIVLEELFLGKIIFKI